MLFTLGMTFSVVLVVTLFPALALGSLVLNVGFDVFPFFAGFFPGDLAALDGFGELSSGICDELVAAAFFFTLGMVLVMFFAPGGFLLAALGLQCPELFTGVFPGELSGLDGLGDLSHGIGRDGTGRDLTVSPGLALVRLFALGRFFLTTLGHQGFHFLTGVFPGELSGLDGLDNLSPGFSELVAAAFFFTLGLGLVATLALGGFPGILISQAFFVTIDRFLESRVGVFLGDLAFLDKLVEILTHLSEPQAAASGVTAVFVPGFWFAILGHRCHRNSENNCCHNS